MKLIDFETTHLSDNPCWTDAGLHAEMCVAGWSRLNQGLPRRRVLLLLVQVSCIGQQGVVVRSILGQLHPQVLHHLGHHKVAAAIELESGCSVFGRPLKVDNVERGSLLGRTVHAPQPGVASQHLNSSEAQNRERFKQTLRLDPRHRIMSAFSAARLAPFQLIGQAIEPRSPKCTIVSTNLKKTNIIALLKIILNVGFYPDPQM